MAIRLNISMEEDLYIRLRKRLPPKRMSAFINAAVRARLHPEKATLDAAYKKASREKWRRTVADEWKVAEMEDWPE